MDGALAELARNWQAALSSPCLPAVAWEILTGRVGARIRKPDFLRLLLSEQQADAVILRHRLGLELRDVAQIMGVSQPVIIGQLRWARSAVQHAAIAR
ncbi:hypothetical protein [Streptomyces nigrescens]|uniref:RNA polymerase sigma factor 70 region 4 type 2 domain-containing protein n=1 Tax=Streptomyces nigrescens TaxID=1920 RepID=A0ABY7J0J1_STRNI|nr:hypothetical protein [Streptomyces nigrescens]WAU03822.1 hypothetical protein STRNI_002017 [Streptomyces nigrescens]